MSRSQHRSQGMGTAERRGAVINYFVTDRGDKAKSGIFENINIGWSRVAGGAEVARLLNQAAAASAPNHPEAIAAMLGRVRPVLTQIVASSDNPLVGRKLAELDEAIALAGGVWVEALTDKFAVTPGATVKVTLSALVRNPGEVTLLGAKLSGSIAGVPTPTIAQAVLVANKPSQYPVTVKVPDGQPYSGPYWLDLPKHGAMYALRGRQETGNPESAPLLTAEFPLKVDGAAITLPPPV